MSVRTKGLHLKMLYSISSLYTDYGSNLYFIYYLTHKKEGPSGMDTGSWSY